MILRPLFAILLMLSLALPVRAAPYSAVYAFGDSLSDVGNVFTATGGMMPAPPYVDGQFSNGPVWVQGLASALGLPALTPSLLGGTNYAYGGAQSGASAVHTATAIDLTGPTGQLAQYFATHPTSDPAALYTLWIGSNDVRAILTSGLAPAQVPGVLGQVVANIDAAIIALAASGAKDLLIVTVPDVGLIPAVRALGPTVQAAATAVSAGLNGLLVSGGGPLPSLSALAAAYGLNLDVLDTFTLLNRAVANPAAFGFNNVTDPCLTASGVCAPTVAEQNRFLYWDDVHPSAGGHAFIAAAAVAVLEVPEPGTLALLGVGLAMVAVRRSYAAVTTNRR